MLQTIRPTLLSRSLRHVRRVVIFVVGMTVVVFGCALLFLPGPAVLVIPAGLAILGLEFAWAKRWMQRGKDLLAKGVNGARNGAKKTKPEADRVKV